MHRYDGLMSLDLDTLPAELANAVRSARRRRGLVAVKPYLSSGPDPLIGEWARELVASGELAAAIAEVSVSDPDLRT